MLRPPTAVVSEEFDELVGQVPPRWGRACAEMYRGHRIRCQGSGLVQRVEGPTRHTVRTSYWTADAPPSFAVSNVVSGAVDPSERCSSTRCFGAPERACCLA